MGGTGGAEGGGCVVWAWVVIAGGEVTSTAADGADLRDGCGVRKGVGGGGGDGMM